MERIKLELLRLRGELVLLACTFFVFWRIGISAGNFEVIVYKLALYAVVAISIHISRQLTFDYIDLEAAIFGLRRFADMPVSIRCVVTGGVLYLYPELIKAVLAAG